MEFICCTWFPFMSSSRCALLEFQFLSHLCCDLFLVCFISIVFFEFYFILICTVIWFDGFSSAFFLSCFPDGSFYLFVFNSITFCDISPTKPHIHTHTPTPHCALLWSVSWFFFSVPASWLLFVCACAEQCGRWQQWKGALFSSLLSCPEMWNKLRMCSMAQLSDNTPTHRGIVVNSPWTLSLGSARAFSRTVAREEKFHNLFTSGLFCVRDMQEVFTAPHCFALSRYPECFSLSEGFFIHSFHCRWSWF